MAILARGASQGHMSVREQPSASLRVDAPSHRDVAEVAGIGAVVRDGRAASDTKSMIALTSI